MNSGSSTTGYSSLISVSIVEAPCRGWFSSFSDAVSVFVQNETNLAQTKMKALPDSSLYGPYQALSSSNPLLQASFTGIAICKGINGQQPLMNAEELMKLFDYCWFENQIFTKQANLAKPSSFEANPENEIREKPSEPEISRISTLHTRSMSDQLSSNTSFGYGSLSPNSVLHTPKLDTNLSGKEVTESETPKQRDFEVSSSKKKVKRSASRRKRGESKSLSDLEFEELKGFMDLGFVFSEEDRNSSLASVIPGLHRLGKKDDEEEAVDESTIPRPYLSEAWEVLDRRKRENPLMNLRVPFPALNNETRMKDTLRLWAHTVASTVR